MGEGIKTEHVWEGKSPHGQWEMHVAPPGEVLRLGWWLQNNSELLGARSLPLEGKEQEGTA